MEDKPVRKTANDAAVSKLSAVARGYYKDDFLKAFVSRAARRPPLINRGYYARVAAFDRVVERFLDETGTSGCGGERALKQIVCLGAGFDTTYFRLKAAGKEPGLYVEVDLPDNTRFKVSTVLKKKTFRTVLPEEDVSTSKDSTGCPSLHAPGYHVVPGDLRDLAAIQTTLAACGVDTSRPTLFISECVLIYVPPEASDALIAWVGKEFTTAAFVTYEQILPDDAFGRVMIANLAERGVVLHGLSAHPDIASQLRRYTSCGFQATVWDMNDIYYKYLPRENVRRIERLELFDELEEWHLMQAHYCIAVAAKGASKSGDAAGTVAGAADVGASDEADAGAAGAGAGAGAGATSTACSEHAALENLLLAPATASGPGPKTGSAQRAPSPRT